MNDQLKQKLEAIEKSAKPIPDTEFDIAQDNRCLNVPQIGSREDKESLNGGYPLDREIKY